MKTVSAEFQAHLESETTTLATCWKITRTDGAAFFFTDHDTDLLFDGNLYQARTGYSRSAIVSDAGLSVDNLDVEGVFDSAEITEQDLRAGLFDQAEVRVFFVNWADLSQGRLRLRRGWFGEVTLSDTGQFRTELRGMTQALSQRIGEVYSPECRADLGDGRCKVDLAGWTRSGSVATVIDRTVFTATVSGELEADGWFAGGVLRWTSGSNTGRAHEVKSWQQADGKIGLYLPPGYAIGPGDGFDIHPGCDKRLTTCVSRFNNVLNFRGEPYLPGQDQYMQVPDAK